MKKGYTKFMTLRSILKCTVDMNSTSFFGSLEAFFRVDHISTFQIFGDLQIFSETYILTSTFKNHISYPINFQC